MREQTNVVFILTDDQGVWAAGCYGNSEIRTPNLDRLAASGIRFSNFFCASARLLAGAGQPADRPHPLSARRTRLAARRQHGGGRLAQGQRTRFATGD